MTPLDADILSFVRDNPGCTNMDIRAGIGLDDTPNSYRLVRRHTDVLSRYKFIDCIIGRDNHKTKHYTVIEGAEA